MRWVLAVTLLLGGCLSSTDELLEQGEPVPDVVQGEPEDAGLDAPDVASSPDVGDVTEAQDVADVQASADVPDVQEAPDVTDAGSGGDAPDGDDAGDTADIVEPPFDPMLCDAGDEAWVKRTVQALLGRKPRGMREVRALVAMVQASDRATVARGLMASQDFEDRWATWLMDELRVNRVGSKAHGACYGPPLRPDDAGEVAAWIRDNAPLKPQLDLDFNMTDVLRSSLRLDDLSPLYRAHLFALMSKPIEGANVADLEMDLTRRQDFGEVFEATYMDRGIVCSGCHNSEWSVTDDPDPKKDRFWPIPGKFEAAIYGQSTGGKELAFYSAFRHLGIVKEAGGARPWHMSPSCGYFNTPNAIEDDPAGWETTFIAPLGKKASIWAVEEALHTGAASIAEGGLQVDPDTLDVAGPDAFAYLVAAHVSNRAWRAVHGTPLVLVHHFPRNEAQRTILMELTDRFVSHGWSLRALLEAVVTHPLANQLAPEAGCGDSPYLLPAVFDPWVISEEDPALWLNGPGDMVHRAGARMLLSMAADALGWPAPLAFPTGGEEQFQKAVGVFVKDGEPGFDGVDFQGMLTWENRYGACETQVVSGGDAGSCVGSCGTKAPAGCWCESFCVGYGDCCGDYDDVCVKGHVPPMVAQPDWIDALAEAVAAHDAALPQDPTTLRRVVTALSDRLLTAPDLSPEQEAVLAALYEVGSLDAAALGVKDWVLRTRGVCGALLQTPQFWLVGIAPPDQVGEPALVVDGATFQQACEQWAPLVFGVDGATCSADGLTLTPAEVP